MTGCKGTLITIEVLRVCAGVCTGLREVAATDGASLLHHTDSRRRALLLLGERCRFAVHWFGIAATIVKSKTT